MNTEQPQPTNEAACGASDVERAVRPKTRGYTERRAIDAGMHYSEEQHCPECGCPWYGNKDYVSEGHRTCCDCYQEWWTDIEYKHTVPRRELPAA
jgi:hypothetical protein